MAATRNVPYSALELEGRDIYVSEGCYTCHSQMIRPFTWETARYGQPNTMDDSIFDHPFQWGSRRIGPDLARVGGKYNHTWHYRHMLDPREISPGSNMPPYTHMAVDTVDFDASADKMRAMRSLGVPYRPEEIQTASESAQRQHDEIVAYLAQDAGVRLCTDGLVYGAEGENGCDLQPHSKLVALISYLQRLGNVPARPAGGAGEGEVALRTNAADAAEVAR
ncbi:MAG: cbb3-type cytochrome c oxidase subunit II [Sandaracinus sp.]|nr:cbb3-type cytochrome c oxidase subunit II [Sandaracinus sp.]